MEEITWNCLNSANCIKSMGGKRSNDDHQYMCVCVIFFSLQAQMIDFFDNKSSKKNSTCIYTDTNVNCASLQNDERNPSNEPMKKPYNYSLINALRSYSLFLLSLSLNLAFIMPGTCIILFFVFHINEILNKETILNTILFVYIYLESKLRLPKN